MVKSKSNQVVEEEERGAKGGANGVSLLVGVLL
jgi:hypothetical protein